MPFIVEKANIEWIKILFFQNIFSIILFLKTLQNTYPIDLFLFTILFIPLAIKLGLLFYKRNSKVLYQFNPHFNKFIDLDRFIRKLSSLSELTVDDYWNSKKKIYSKKKKIRNYYQKKK
jgi:hypothetical protein